MEKFLKTVAAGYKKKYKDLSRLTFVLPNKRSGSYLLKYFKELAREAMLAPRIIPVTDFIDSNIETVKDSRIDLVFRLFKSFCRVQKESDISFERFSSWGETMLSDFNEVDMQMVDPDEIFKNVSDLNSIRSSFLTEEQKKVMVEYFGYSPEKMHEETVRFWEEFKSDDDSGSAGDSIRDSRKKFYTLWQLLPRIYKDFKEQLAADGFTTEGGAYRETVERIEAGFEPFKGDKLIFVGFNALAEAERRIFKALKRIEIEIEGQTEEKADFIWDLISDKIAQDSDPAVRFVNINARRDNFPMPEWIVDDIVRGIPDFEPEIEVIAVPSNMMQVKVASEILSEWKRSAPDIPDKNTAVVLPDESLLLPLLHSLPEEYEEPNLTMGFPLKQTSVISFASLLRHLHQHSGLSGKKVVFLFEDVKDLLSHPYAHILFDSGKISKFVAELEKHKKIVVTVESLEGLGENANLLFRYFEEDTSPVVVTGYLLEVFNRVKDALYESDTYINANIEKAYIVNYNDALVRLTNCIGEYDISISPSGVFLLADRLVAGEKVAFEGEPLKGLQVMGVLETRCLDFDRVVMLSVNEKVIPRVGRNSTFIPNVIRGAYGMPPANYQEEIFSYYFFRLLGRCRRGLLTYDSRSSDTRNPGASRYLLQMKYLPGGFKMSETEARFRMPSKSNPSITVAKDENISSLLYRFECGKNIKLLPGREHKNFSASSLRDYMACPLKFLYKYVLGLYVEREKLETIDAIDLGTIIHSTIENLYLPSEKDRRKLLERPVVFTEDKLKALLKKQTPDGHSLIREVAKREIIRTHFKETEGELRGSAVYILDYIVEYVKNIIRADIQQAPFRLWGVEIEETVKYPLSDGRKINVKMVIDRLDQKGESGIDEPFRIVDYKSGSVHLKAESFEDIFNGSYVSENIFQLILYARLLVFLLKTSKISLPSGINVERFERNLEICIYSILKLPNLKEGILHPEIMGEKIITIGDLRNLEQMYGMTFDNELESLILKILDRNEPFKGQISDSSCRYCDFKLRCEVQANR